MARIKKISNSRRIFEIDIPADVVSAKSQELYSELAKTASVPGFRRGKVPMDLIKPQYAGAVKEEVLRRLVPLHYDKALKESGLRTIGQPQVSDVNWSEGGGLSFSAAIDIRPEIKIPSYKGISLKRKKTDIKDEQVEKVIDMMRQRNAEYIAVIERAAASGDIAICDIEASIDGKPQKKQEKVWVTLDDKTTLPDIVNALIGTKPSDMREVKLTLPEDFAEKQYAKKPAEFNITVFEVKEKRLPALNDEFAKSAGNCSSLTELREKIKQGLVLNIEQQAKLDLEAQVLDKLIKSTKFDLPEGILEAQKEKLYHDMVHDLKTRGAKDEEIKNNDSALREKAAQNAERSVRIYFILEEIAQREPIKIEPGELEDEINLMAEKSGQGADELKKYVEDKGLTDSLLLEIRERKTLEFLLNNARIDKE
ncbi:MAG: trigger factor [Candidatus Omnitrophota bacterium]